MHAAEQFRCEKRNAGKRQLLAFGKTVADLNIAVIGNTDNVARISLFRESRSCDINVTTLEAAISRLIRKYLHLHTALNLPEHTRKAMQVAVFQIHIGEF